MAVKDIWLGNAQNKNSWRDMMFKVTGPLARSLQIAFSELWTSSCGEILFGLGIYPSQLSSDTTLRYIHLVSSPSEAMSLEKFMWLSMAAAKHKLYIVTPYFVPDHHTMEILLKLAKEGVDVRLMVPNEHTDAQTVRWNGQNFYYDLLQAGVRIFEYQPTFIHSKYLVVDGNWSVIGSTNQNYRSRNLDEENTFGIRDETLAQELEKTFDEDTKVSKEITLKVWRKRSKLLKILVAFSRVLEQQS
jgi:cardiolipin synthase A/B